MSETYSSLLQRGLRATSSVSLYGGTSLIWTPTEQKREESVVVSEVSSFQRLKCMQEWYILGVEKGVLFREVSSVQKCRFHICSTLTSSIYISLLSFTDNLSPSLSLSLNVSSLPGRPRSGCGTLQLSGLPVTRAECVSRHGE